ncbi:hypothetical protein NPX13_g655 [Xylaria arbuscula]|uniref:Uncharacterized protein n=1 Tax=Xylaria arbuscula TaxID=114810 RepID=A0A9W8NMV3_9PEZI|nr:hypothetical protein NPX13_g655 [Xylaria arbuscula]
MYRFRDMRPGVPRKAWKALRLLTWGLVGLIVLDLVLRGRGILRQQSTDCLSRCTFPMREADPNVRTYEYNNTFSAYKHFGDRCNISSLDIHVPYEPVCPTRASMLTAMSSGGRIGRDAIYIPRGCDMRWYTTEEVCKILGRFSQVILVGDSMLRHVIGALNIIVREDLGYGGVTDWNFDAREKERCFCNDQFDVTDCSVQGIYKTEDVIKHDPGSLACPRLVPVEQMVRYPMEGVELDRLKKAIDSNSNTRKAFILGHGLWNDLELEKAKSWLNTVLDVIDSKLNLRVDLKRSYRGKNLPVLLMTPNAAGAKKPDEYILTQGNKALVHFEHAMAQEAATHSIDHLGTWNMSIQANLYDGVHMDLRGNLLKAMMVVNWLDLLSNEDTGA